MTTPPNSPTASHVGALPSSDASNPIKFTGQFTPAGNAIYTPSATNAGDTSTPITDAAECENFPSTEPIVAAKRMRGIERKLTALCSEVREARRSWLGGDYDHLSLFDALEKFRADQAALRSSEKLRAGGEEVTQLKFLISEVLETQNITEACRADLKAALSFTAVANSSVTEERRKFIAEMDMRSTEECAQLLADHEARAVSTATAALRAEVENQKQRVEAALIAVEGYESMFAELARLRGENEWLAKEIRVDTPAMVHLNHEVIVRAEKAEAQLAAAAEREAKLREALETMLVGAYTVGVPNLAEREVLIEAVAIARNALAQPAPTDGAKKGK